MAEVITYSKKAKSHITTYNRIAYSVNLKAIRISKGLTQSDLARETGFTSEYINMIEHGKRYPILETRIKISRALNVDSSSIWIPIAECPGVVSANELLHPNTEPVNNDHQPSGSDSNKLKEGGNSVSS